MLTKRVYCVDVLHSVSRLTELNWPYVNDVSHCVLLSIVSF